LMEVLRACSVARRRLGSHEKLIYAAMLRTAKASIVSDSPRWSIA
jgi:hypothetical protein